MPGLAAELRERGRPAVGADVARELGQLVVRDEQPVLALELEVDVVARDAADRLGVEAEEAADAVLDVHDVVAGPQIGRARERAAEAPGDRGARRAAPEQLLRRDDGQARRRPHDAAPQRRDGEDDAGLVRQRLPRGEQRRLDAAQGELRALGVAAVREGDDDAQAGAHEPEQLGLGLADAAARQRGPLRLEARVALQRVERADALEQLDHGRLAHVGAFARRARVARRGLGQAVARRLEHALGLPGAEHAVGDQLRRQRDEVVRDGDVLVECVHSSTSAGCAARLARRLQIAALELGQRALREHREARDALDLVAEQLDAHRLGAGRREDVEDVAAHRQLAAIADTLDARVARSRRARRRASSRGELSPALDVQGRGRRSGGGMRSTSAAAEIATSPAGLEQPEPARALADEVRRGLEPRAVGDAARGDESDHRPPARTRPPRRPPRARSRRRRTSTARPAARLAAAALPERGQRAARARPRGTRARARQRRIERACELRDAGLCGDLVRDGREVGEVRVRAFGPCVVRPARGRRLQDSLRPVTDTLLDELCDWLRIPSISSGGGDPADLLRAAEWACERIARRRRQRARCCRATATRSASASCARAAPTRPPC